MYSLTMATTCKSKIYLRSLLSTPASLLLFIVFKYDALAFHSYVGPEPARRTALNVQLSPRQLQFWEDVEGEEIFADHNCAT
jgi:hypothetical protein